MRKLDAIGQDIWNFGFNDLILQHLDILSKEVSNGTTVFERIPPQQLSGLSAGSEILCAAAIICRGCPCTESETREIYCTDDLAGEGIEQIILVEEWARRKSVWFDNPEQYLEDKSIVRDYGTESVVYFDVENKVVYKLISLKHYNVLRLALDRIIVHNAIFPDSALKVIGFGNDEAGRFVVMVKQPYISGNGVSENERMVFMAKLGFTEAGGDYGMHLNYKTDDLYVGDLNRFNVIKGEYGIHVIDADCRLNVPTLGCGGKYIMPKPSIDFSRPNGLLLGII